MQPEQKQLQTPGVLHKIVETATTGMVAKQMVVERTVVSVRIRLGGGSLLAFFARGGRAERHIFIGTRFFIGDRSGAADCLRQSSATIK